MEQAADADYASVYGVFDPSGAGCAAMSTPACAPRAASASRTCRSTGSRPAGRRSLVVSAARPCRSARPATWRCVTFEDVTELEARAPRARRCSPRRPRTSARSLDPHEVARVGRGADGPARSPTGASSSCCSPTATHRRATRSRWPTRPSARSPRSTIALLPARPGLAGRLAAGHPHRRAAADRRAPAASSSSSPRPTPSSARCCAALGFRSIDDRAAARPRARDRRPRARDGASRAAASARRTSRSPSSSPTAARSRSTTRGCTPSSEAVAPRAAGEEVNTILGGRRRRRHRAGAGRHARLRQRGRGAAASGYRTASRSCSPRRPASSPARFEMLGEDGGPLAARAPARPARAARRAARAADRALAAWRGTREWRWTRVKATPVLEPGRHACALAINVIEDITDLKQAEEGQRLPRRGRPRARRLARLRGDAAPRSPGSPCPTSPTGARSTSLGERRARARRDRRTPTRARSRRSLEIARALPARPAGADRASTACCAAGARSCTPRSPTRCSRGAAQRRGAPRAAALDRHDARR